MRSQSITVQTGKTKKLLLICITMTFICGIIALIGFRMSAGTAKFVAPALDINAKVGMPSPEQGLNFGSVTAPTGFSSRALWNHVPTRGWFIDYLSDQSRNK